MLTRDSEQADAGEEVLCLKASRQSRLMLSREWVGGSWAPVSVWHSLFTWDQPTSDTGMSHNIREDVQCLFLLHKNSRRTHFKSLRIIFKQGRHQCSSLTWDSWWHGGDWSQVWQCDHGRSRWWPVSRWDQQTMQSSHLHQLNTQLSRPSSTTLDNFYILPTTLPHVTFATGNHYRDNIKFH